MKILDTGDATKGKWWIGLRLVCKSCGRTVELEADDDMHPYWMPYMNEEGVVCVMCETCGFVMRWRGRPNNRICDTGPTE